MRYLARLSTVIALTVAFVASPAQTDDISPGMMASPGDNRFSMDAIPLPLQMEPVPLLMLEEDMRSRLHPMEMVVAAQVFHQEYWHEYARYVQSLTNVRLDSNGVWRIETMFSNGNRQHPQPMSIRIVAVTAEGECLFGATQEAMVPTSGGLGGAKEVTRTTTGRIPEDEVALFSEARFSASQATSAVIAMFNQVRPYGQTLPNGEPRAC